MSLCSKLPLSSSHAFSFVGLIFECVHKRPVGTELAHARAGQTHVQITRRNRAGQLPIQCGLLSYRFQKASLKQCT